MGKEQLTPFQSLSDRPAPCQLLHQDPPALERADQLSEISVKASLQPGASLPASPSAWWGGGGQSPLPAVGENQGKMMYFLRVLPPSRRKGAHSALPL